MATDLSPAAVRRALEARAAQIRAEVQAELARAGRAAHRARVSHPLPRDPDDLRLTAADLGVGRFGRF
ncbi:hypothetical protein [Methylobacterium hispanicum]|uniref:hypothetical protein n=1 Tax=Methylobacterium hispanicum TaxID=270350 RepID=UPI002F2F30AE